MNEPIIEPYAGKDYTKIIFKPDLKRFNISKLSADMIGLMRRRVYDMAGILKVKVYLNGKFIQIANFK
jgi:DNA topoisomerase-2